MRTVTDRIFHATVTRHRDDPHMMVVEVAWPRLSCVVDDHLDATEVAERLIGNHFAVEASTISVDVRSVLDG